MEQLLHYVWKHKIFPLKEQITTDGQTLEIIDPGLPNRNAGPDFFNAKIKLNGVLWVGNVEIHTDADDWFKHGHHLNKVYDSVILHVCSRARTYIYRSNGEIIPQFLLECPSSLCENYRELLATDHYPPCYRIIPTLSTLLIHSWMSALQVERFEQKSLRIKEYLISCNQHWEDAFFIALARNFGFGLNGDAFETWAKHLPLRAVDKHRDNLFQIEALFFGQAGLLEETDGDETYLSLKKEYTYLAHKFGLSPMEGTLWRFLRLRPQNFPHVRIAQLACLYHRSYGLFSLLMEKESLKEIREILKGGTSLYWLTHYQFKETSPACPKTLSDTSIDLLIINTVVPFLYTFGKHKGNDTLCPRASRFLEELKPENNHIVRTWAECGLKAAHAGDSQALIQLKKEYCDRKRCLYCRLGYYYLTKR